MDILAGTPYEHLDPSTQLNTLDVVKLLFEYCNKVVDSCLRSERKDNDESFKQVFQQLSKVTESLINCIKTQETKINDLDLKIDTIGSYIEHLVYGLKKGLQETFCLVQKDMEFLFTKSAYNHHSQDLSALTSTVPQNRSFQGSTQPFCNPCGLAFTMLDDFQRHLKEKHNQDQLLSDCYACSLCDNLFTSVSNLEFHLRCFHGESAACRCLDCDHIFRSESDLSIHIKDHHRTNQSLRCQRCEQNFLTVHDMDNHLCNGHMNCDVSCDPVPASDKVFECVICANTFDNFSDLCEHNESSHTAHEFYPCDVCEKTFVSLETLEDHITDVHSLQQLDGPIQELFDFAGPSNQDSVRTKPFALNRTRQINDIRKDSTIADFDITVNNHDENCTIKCSSGFYIQVAQSCFTTLKENTVLSIGGIVVSISQVTKSNDKSGSEVNRLLRFAFVSEHQSYGGVAVHLHHSTRTIQVQGSHEMPDKSKAALWFVKNVIVKKFEEQAKVKKFAIKKFNDTVQRTFTNHEAVPKSSNACSECSLLFNTRSKPSMCSSCSVYFHKTCLKDHAKTCTGSSSTASSLESLHAPTSTATNSVARSSTSALSWPASASSSGTQTLPPPTSGPNAEAAQSSSVPTIPGLRTLVTFLPRPPACSQPLAPSVPPPPCLPPATEPLSQSLGSNNRNATKKKNKPVPIPNVSTHVELLQRELAAAQARITQLDATVVDKEQQVEILLARVKVLEDDKNKQVYDKYFPTTHQTPVIEQSTMPSHCNQSSNYHCQAHQWCPTSHHSCCHAKKCHPERTPCHSLCQTPPSHTCFSSELVMKFEKQFERMNSEINKIKVAAALSNGDEGSNEGSQVEVDMGKNDEITVMNPQQTNSESLHELCTSPASMCSIEEFIPENPLNQSNLNL